MSTAEIAKLRLQILSLTAKLAAQNSELIANSQEIEALRASNHVQINTIVAEGVTLQISRG